MTTEEIKEAEDYASQNSRYYDDHEQDWNALKVAYLAGRQVGIEENELLRKENAELKEQNEALILLLRNKAGVIYIKNGLQGS